MTAHIAYALYSGSHQGVPHRIGVASVVELIHAAADEDEGRRAAFFGGFCQVVNDFIAKIERGSANDAVAQFFPFDQLIGIPNVADHGFVDEYGLTGLNKRTRPFHGRSQLHECIIATSTASAIASRSVKT